jgi:hypothetical protein
MEFELKQVICDTFLRPHQSTPRHLRPHRPHRLRSRPSVPAEAHNVADSDECSPTLDSPAVSSPDDNSGLVSRGCVLSTRGGGRTFARRRKSWERSRRRRPWFPRLRGGRGTGW